MENNDIVRRLPAIVKPYWSRAALSFLELLEQNGIYAKLYQLDFAKAEQ